MLSISVLIVYALSACGSAHTSSPASTPASTSLPATAQLTSTAAAPSQQPGNLEYSTVAEALADLNTRPDVSVAVLQGWTIVTGADGQTNWSFPPADHPAYPAVAKRVLYRDQDGWHLEMDILCEAQTAACEDFVRYFEALNEPIYQLTEQQKP